MAHVLNRPERNHAFWKFLLFFLISTALIVGAVYFPVHIPTKDNEMLREQVSLYNTQAAAQDRFVKEMKSIEGLFDSLNNPGLTGTSQTYYSNQISTKIVALHVRLDRDSSMYSELNSNVANVYLHYLEKTNTSNSITGLQRELTACKIDKEKVESKLEQANSNLQMMSRNSPGTGFDNH